MPQRPRRFSIHDLSEEAFVAASESRRLRLRALRAPDEDTEQDLLRRSDELRDQAEADRDLKSFLLGGDRHWFRIDEVVTEDVVEQAAASWIRCSSRIDEEGFREALKAWEEARDRIRELREMGVSWGSLDSFSAAMDSRGPRSLLTHRRRDMPDWTDRGIVEDAEDLLACLGVRWDPTTHDPGERLLASIEAGLRPRPKRSEYSHVPEEDLEWIETCRRALLDRIAGR